MSACLCCSPGLTRQLACRVSRWQAFDVQLQPGKFFLTCAEFDYTMVACDHSNDTLRGTQPIPLRPSSDQPVEEGAAIQITQHPEGRPKQTSIQEHARSVA